LSGIIFFSPSEALNCFNGGRQIIFGGEVFVGIVTGNKATLAPIFALIIEPFF
jgi:hypothetical protein